MMQQEYGTNIPKHNPHFITGTMKAHPQTDLPPLAVPAVTDKAQG